MPMNRPGSSTDRRARDSVRLGGFCVSFRFKPAQVPVVDIDGGYLAAAVAAAIEAEAGRTASNQENGIRTSIFFPCLTVAKTWFLPNGLPGTAKEESQTGSGNCRGGLCQRSTHGSFG